MGKPLHHKLSKEDQKKHFKHELGIVDATPKGGVTDAYREGWQRIFGNKSPQEDTDDHDREKKA